MPDSAMPLVGAELALTNNRAQQAAPLHMIRQFLHLEAVSFLPVVYADRQDAGPSIGILKSNREKEEDLVATSRAERGIARHS